jgi:hypothetical protein
MRRIHAETQLHSGTANPIIKNVSQVRCTGFTQ